MTTDNPTEQPGLRERKKLATREALGLAALHLCAERGLDNVRVEDIASAAGVSPRTYNNYFSSREEAICAVGVERAKRVGGALKARPPGEPLSEAIVHAMVEQYTLEREPDRTVATHIQMVVQNPALRGEFLKGMAAMEADLAAAIAERAGIDQDQDLFPRILAAAVSGAARIAMEKWLRSDTPAAYSDLLREAVTIAAGIAVGASIPRIVKL
jgi:AcrR family transcriptional regulator